VIYSGVAVDLFSDGVMIGTGSTIAFGLALLLALAQAPANVPEGFATVGKFKARGVPRGRRLLLAASLALPILLGASISYWVLRGQPELWKFSLVAATAGYLTAVTVEEMVPEAHAEAKGGLARAAFVGGFTLFALFSTFFG
jgi:ZIP family zinc transporter